MTRLTASEAASSDRHTISAENRRLAALDHAHRYLGGVQIDIGEFLNTAQRFEDYIFGYDKKGEQGPSDVKNV